MSTYTQDSLLRIARRVNNTKRTYLLVNPLQAKHIPVSPTRSLGMMNSLGQLLAGKYPGTRLVIGFAETATAVGAAVADCFPKNCVYLTTTREPAPAVEKWVRFTEEHSHATEQKLCGDGLEDRIRRTDSVIFVDDEISTGKTLRNVIAQLRAHYPQLTEKRLVAASILNRVSREDEALLNRAGVVCEYLLKISDDRAAQIAEAYDVTEGTPVQATEPLVLSHRGLDCPALPVLCVGTEIGTLQAGCYNMARAFWKQAGPVLKELGSAVVLGTEECMYPALILGQTLEEEGLSVRCHATTRSPIGICSASGYPITSGHKLPSFYKDTRTTYLYNFTPCEALIIVSDAPVFQRSALEQLAAAWKPYGYQKLFFILAGRDVWYTEGRT